MPVAALIALQIAGPVGGSPGLADAARPMIVLDEIDICLRRDVGARHQIVDVIALLGPPFFEGESAMGGDPAALPRRQRLTPVAVRGNEVDDAPQAVVSAIVALPEDRFIALDPFRRHRSGRVFTANQEVVPRFSRIDLANIQVGAVVKSAARIGPEIGIANPAAGAQQYRKQNRDDRRSQLRHG